MMNADLEIDDGYFRITRNAGTYRVYLLPTSASAE